MLQGQWEKHTTVVDTSRIHVPHTTCPQSVLHTAMPVCQSARAFTGSPGVYHVYAVRHAYIPHGSNKREYPQVKVPDRRPSFYKKVAFQINQPPSSPPNLTLPSAQPIPPPAATSSPGLFKPSNHRSSPERSEPSLSFRAEEQEGSVVFWSPSSSQMTLWLANLKLGGRTSLGHISGSEILCPTLCYAETNGSSLRV